ncbi:Protein of unknown function [Thermoactinomyces sp. DSM 45891]|uniref:glycohydrolase toxin TNT-related protein n=1 Tax=Thermoactinomyces sp. DSM 45891 TaxID=1761907 RepID=UPI000910B705|nr:glycohydrolase toxin TNT-related protein [Thermoactinomyces sp. DSM 45891]SFX76089.1 Protein of unknown function [Thermoactinomyces sp. DSM 45891]
MKKKNDFVILLVMMMALYFMGNGVAVAGGFIDQTPIESQFDKEMAKDSTQEKGFWESAWDSIVEFGEGIVETASDFVDWLGDVLAPLKDIVVGAWDWIVKNWEVISAVALVIAGVACLFIPGFQGVGIAVLVGSAFGGITGLLTGESGKDLAKSVFLGGLCAIPGLGVAAGVTKGTGLFIKGGILGKYLPGMFGAGAGAGTEQGLFDWGKTGKINWKSVALAGVFGAGMFLGITKAEPAFKAGWDKVMTSVFGEPSPAVANAANKATEEFNKASAKMNEMFQRNFPTLKLAGVDPNAGKIDFGQTEIRGDFHQFEGNGSRADASAISLISPDDKVKIDRWDYPPSEKDYLEHKKTFDNPDYYDQETGAINWPKDDGFQEGTRGMKDLEVGAILDRYGEPKGGYFLSPAGTPYEQRALAVHSKHANHYKYRVNKPFAVEGGEIAPYFDQPGGGTQFFTQNVTITGRNGAKITSPTVQDLLDHEYLVKD